MPQACNYIRQTAVGLQHAHERPDPPRYQARQPFAVFDRTYFVAGQGRSRCGAGKGQKGKDKGPIVKILDLGLARLAHPVAGSKTTNLTVLGTAIMQGTPDYLAPEQALNFHTADTPPTSTALAAPSISC